MYIFIKHPFNQTKHDNRYTSNPVARLEQYPGQWTLVNPLVLLTGNSARITVKANQII